MIRQPEFPVDAWALRETELNVARLAQTESLFALANGHIGVRGNLDEGEPHGLPGTYVNSFCELRPLPYAEAGYGFPESGQAIVNVTNGKIIRLLVDDEPFDVRYGRLRAHERTLDFRAGVLRRRAEWESPGLRTVRVSSTRLVSFVQRTILAVEYQVEAVGGPAKIVVQSELVANEPLPVHGGDPRVAAILQSPLVNDDHGADETGVHLVHHTRRSGLHLGAKMSHQVEGPDGLEMSALTAPDLGRATFIADLEAGQRLRVVKFVAYGWSSRRSGPALRDQVAAAIVGALHSGWDGLLAEQRAYLDEFWASADVEVDGDDEVQQAIRFALWHVLQSGARAEGRAIAAKGLTGPGYDGHAFWDSETFILPVLTYTAPQSAAAALRWRHGTLGLARERAATLGLPGAAFPWRTIRGEECSAYWPAGTAAFHVGADIAAATVRYVAVTGDEAFDREIALEILVETARLWTGLGHYDTAGRFRIDGVTGPDEYSAVADNNVYTNLMAQLNLTAAADVAARYPAEAGELSVDDPEIASWRRAASQIFIPWDDEIRIHPQAEGFTEHQAWDFAATAIEQYPLMLHFPYFELYRKQVVKQADLVLAMHLRGDAFTDAQKARNFAYYERLTVRDSSLSACTQAVLAAEIGHLDLAYDYLAETALIDLDDLQRNTGDGIHIASLAGTWIAVVAGFGGLRDHDGQLSFGPRLPRGLARLRFNLSWRDCRLRVEITPGAATYELLAGASLDFQHHRTSVSVRAGEPVTLALPAAPSLLRPTQPPGRAPRIRAVAP